MQSRNAAWTETQQHRPAIDFDQQQFLARPDRKAFNDPQAATALWAYSLQAPRAPRRRNDKPEHDQQSDHHLQSLPRAYRRGARRRAQARTDGQRKDAV